MFFLLGDKPFECKLCGKRFTQSGSRGQHLIRHHLDDEIRKNLKQELLNSGSQGDQLQDGSDGAGGNSNEPDCNSSGSEVSKLTRVEASNEANTPQPEMETVSCSPQVLVLSNPYPGRESLS